MKNLLFVLLAATAGCATQQPATFAPIAFNETEFASLPEKGTGTAVVSGQIFLKTRGGDVKKGAGENILLMPVTDASTQIINETSAGRVANPPRMDRRYGKYFSVVVADANGRFRFDKVPAGKYFVTGRVAWEAPTQFGMTRQGGMIVKTVVVANDKTTEVMLTR